MTACSTVSPRKVSAVSFIFWRIKALISDGLYFSAFAPTQASPFSPSTISYGTRLLSLSVSGSSNRRPIRRLTAKIVFSGFVTAWRFAAWPTRRSEPSENATIDGVVRAPSEFSITLPAPPSMTATQELVVPRSIPITFAMSSSLFSRPARPKRHRHRPLYFKLMSLLRSPVLFDAHIGSA